MPLMASLACVIAGLGFYMLHNTLQVNATQMAPTKRGSSVALFAAAVSTGPSSAIPTGIFRSHSQYHSRVVTSRAASTVK